MTDSSAERSSDEKPSYSKSSGCLAGMIGAILIHPIVFIFAFLKGFVLGGGRLNIMSATGSARPASYGFRGGWESVQELLIIEIFTFGVPIVILSVIGYVGSSLYFRKKSQTTSP